MKNLTAALAVFVMVGSGVAKADPISEFRSILPFQLNDTFSGSFSYDVTTPEVPNYSTLEALYHFLGCNASLLDWEIGGTEFHQYVGQEAYAFVQDGASTPWHEDNFCFTSSNALNSDWTNPENFALPAGWQTTTSGSGSVGIYIVLRDHSDTVFSDRSLPSSLALSDFDSASVGFNFPASFGNVTLTTPLGSFTGEQMQFWGSIDSLTPIPSSSSIRTYSFTGHIDRFEAIPPRPVGGGGETVPEPSTLGVWSILGSLGLIGAWRRQKRDTAMTKLLSTAPSPLRSWQQVVRRPDPRNGARTNSAP